MTRRVLSILRHTIRAAIRSRVVVGLLLLLGAVVVILPRTLRGDGTPASEVRMLLTWTLGTTVSLLGAATLWGGCSSVASDVEDGTLTGVVVTPIRAFELCLGKWLGLVVLNAALLAAVLGVAAVQLVLRGVPSSELAPSERVLPSEASIAVQAEALLGEARRQGVLPADATPAALRREVLRRIRNEHLAVNPGESYRWEFDWPAGVDSPDSEVRVQLDVLSSFGTVAGVDGTCRVRNAEGREVASFAMASEDGRHVVHVLRAGDLAAAGAITVQLDNEAAADGAAVLVRAADGAVLLVPAGSFVGNLMASGVVLWAMLSALAAVGVCAGTMFSLPVAVFAASAVMVVGLLSRTDLEESAGCGHDHSSGDTCATLTHPFAATVLGGIARVVAPVADAEPLDRLGDRVLLDGADVARAVGVVGVAVPVLFAAVGGFVLRRREFR